MKKHWTALIIVSWIVSASPVLAMGAENPPSAVEKQPEPRTGTETDFTGPEKSASEIQRQGDRSTGRKRTRYGMGYESRRQSSRSNMQSRQSGHTYNPSRSKQKR